MPVILSVICNAVLYAVLIYEYTKTCKKKQSSTYYNMVLLILLTLLLGFYIYSINIRKMVYTWDFANYYRIQLRYRNYFDASVTGGIKSVAVSLLMDDYNCFISIFCEMYCRIFRVNTVNGYIMAYFVAAVVPVITAFSMMIRSFMERFHKGTPACKKACYAIIMSAFVFMPLVNYPALLGQPDIFGLVFVMILINEALSYNFAVVDIKTWLVIFGCTIALLLTRRWYIYWAAAFFVIWFVTLAMTSREKKKALKNMVSFAAISLIIGGVTLFPLFKRILTYDYKDRYSFYNLGGMSYEISNQINYLGIVMAVLILTAAAAGLADKRLRAVTAGAVLSIAACMLMITRVQNSAEHQSLIYVTSYIMLLMILLCARTALPDDRHAALKAGFLQKAVMAAAAAVVAVNAAVSVSGGAKPLKAGDRNIALFTGIDTKPVVRDDWEDIGAVYEYLAALTARGNHIYIVPHGRKYNPDTFRNYKAPSELEEYIPYGACVTGTHRFPVEFLTYEYIMTCSPVDDLDEADNSIVKNFNKAAGYLAQQGVLEENSRFEFDNGYTFIIYKRNADADYTEAEYLKNLFWYQSQKYPEDFEGVLESYEKNLIHK